MKDKSRKFLSTGIYVRVSTEDQAQEGYSIRAQIEKLKAYALLKEWEIYDIYSDEGISGKNIVDRPEINRLIDDINNGNVNNVLVFKVDRLTRSTKNLIELVDLFEENNCAFNSLTESIDTDTPSGRMFLKIIGIFAEFERENLASRLKLGFERKVKEGYTLANNTISYGYIKEKGQKVQEIQPNEARIIKEIFSMYVDENKSFNGIAKALNERKIKTKKGTECWEAATIRNILVNPTYIGKVRYSMMDEDKYFEVDGHHKGIITGELFYLAQEKIKNTPNTLKTKRPKERNYFCGILSCSLCGGKFTTKNVSNVDENGKRKYNDSYRCSNKVYHNDNIACTSPTIGHAKVEKAFIDYINNINDLNNIDDVNIEDNATQEKNELLQHITDHETKIINLENRKKRVMEQYVCEEIEFNEYKSLLSVLNERYGLLESELHKLKAKLPTEKESVKILPEDVVLNIRQNWEKLDDNEKMTFMHRFVKNITLTVEKERANSSVAKIENIEFNLTDIPLNKNQRTKIRGVLKKNFVPIR